MAYVSLYRKYRPQTFAEVVGQTHVTRTLSNAITEDRLHHAYLFTGPRGTGKTSTARILAKSLNCEQGPTAEPCNRCPHCVGITDGSHVDVIEIDAASHGGVDDVRDLRDRVAFAPATARLKVYIVDECHMLSTAGWNAFLKTVEEPPGHVLFVFATTEPHKVLETILSRTQRFDFKRVGAHDLAAHLKTLGDAEQLSYEPGAVELIVRAGDGSVRDTLSVLDQVIAFTGRHISADGVAGVLGTVPDELLSQAADLVAAGDVAGVCMLVQRLADAGQDLRQFTRDAVEHFRRLLMLQVAPDAGLVDTTPQRLAELQAQSGRLGRTEILRTVELLAEAQAQMRRGNTRLPLEIALVKAAIPEASGDPGALAARIDRLERRTGVDVSASVSPAPGAEGAAGASSTPDREPTHPPRGGVDAAPDPETEPDSPTASAPPAPDRSPAHPPRSSAGDADAATDVRSATEEDSPSQVSEPGPAGGGGAVEAVDLTLVTRAWPAIMDGVRARKKTTHAYLSMGTPVALEGEVLVLEFPGSYGFHAENCGSDANQEVIGGVIDEVLGIRPRLRCVLGDGEGPPPPVAEGEQGATASADDHADVIENEEAERAGELPDDATAHEQALETLTRDLGAEVLEDDPGT